MLLCKLCSTDEYRVCCDGCFDASSSIGFVPTVLLLRRVDAVPASEGSESSGGGGSRLTLKPGWTGKVLLPIGGLCTAHEGRGGALGERITAGEVGRRRFNGDRTGLGSGARNLGSVGFARGDRGLGSVGFARGDGGLGFARNLGSVGFVRGDRGGFARGDRGLGSARNLGFVGFARRGLGSGGGDRGRLGWRLARSEAPARIGGTGPGRTSRTVGFGFTSTGFLSLVLTTVVFVRLINSGTRLSNGLTGFGRLGISGISGGSGLCAPACAGPCTLWCSASFRRCFS